MWFTGYFFLATSTFCVALGLVPNQLPQAFHKVGIKPPSYIYDSDESDDTIIKHQSSSSVKSGSSSISFNNGFDDVGFSKQSFSTKTSSKSIQIEADSDDSDSLQEFFEDVGEDAILSSTKMSSSGINQSISDIDILSGRSMGGENLQENMLMDNSEILSDMISSTMEENIILPTVQDQTNMIDMEDIIEEMTEATDTMTLSEIEENLATSNLINNGPILPMQNAPSINGRPPGMGDVFPPNMMKPKIPGSMINPKPLIPPNSMRLTDTLENLRLQEDISNISQQNKYPPMMSSYNNGITPNLMQNIPPYMKPKHPLTGNSVLPSQSNMNNLPNKILPSMPKPYQAYPTLTPPVKMPTSSQQLHPTGYIPSSADLNSLSKLKSPLPGMGNQYNKPTSIEIPAIPAIPSNSMPTPMKKPLVPSQLSSPLSSNLPPMKKPYTPYQFPPQSMPPLMKKPYGLDQHSSPPLMPTPSPKYKGMVPFGEYPHIPRENPFLPPHMRKSQIPYLPSTASESLTDLENFTETWPQMNGFRPHLPRQSYNSIPGMNYEMDLPGMNLPGMNLPGMNSPGMNLPGMNLPGMNLPGMNRPGMNGPPYMPKYRFDDIDDMTENFLNARDYGSLNSPYMKNIPMDFAYSQLDTLDSYNDLKYPYGPQFKNYPLSSNISPYSLGNQEYPYTTPRYLDKSLGMPFWPYFGVPRHSLNQKHPYTPISGYPYSSAESLDLPYSSFPKPKLPTNQPRNNLGVDLPLLPEYSPSKPTYNNYPNPLESFPGLTPNGYYPSLYPSKLPPFGTVPRAYPKQLYPPKFPPSGIDRGIYPQPLYPSKLLPPKTIPGTYPKPLNLPGTIPSTYPEPLYPPKLPPGKISDTYPKPWYPPKLPPSGMIPNIFPKPLHPPKLPPQIVPSSYPKPPYLPTLPFDIVPGNYPYSVQSPNGAYPLDISYLIDEQPELYSYFDAIFVSAGIGSLIAAKELSDAGQRVLITSSGSYPPPESYNFYLRPQILTQTNNIRTGPINIPGAFSPKKFLYPKFLGGITEISPNNWDYGTKQKNQQWSNLSPAWKWENIVELYDAVELIPGEIDAEGIIPINRNLPRTQTIEYISSALQDLGLNDLGTEYSLRDQPGSMMLPVVAEEGPGGLQAVLFTEEVLEDMYNPENVFLTMNTKIESIDIIGDRASGVTIKTPSGQKYSINAQNVIMDGTPGQIVQLLYKAGLGDAMVLDKLQIPTQQHLPAMGKHWIVNPMFTGSFFIFPPGSLKELGNSDLKAKEEFLQNQYDIQSGILLEHFKAFISIQNESEPNVMINFYVFTESIVERLNALMEGFFQFDETTQMYIRDLLQTNDLLFAMPQLTDTKSQGEIVINSQADLNFPPNLNSGMYTNPKDMSIMLEALQFVESLGETPTFQMLGANYMQISVDACIGCKSFETYNKCVISNLSVPGLYSSGGTRMGTNSLNSVVNPNLQVHGMENLFIMNSAVVPNGAGVESAAIDSLIGQYGAKFILRKNNLSL